LLATTDEKPVVGWDWNAGGSENVTPLFGSVPLAFE